MALVTLPNGTDYLMRPVIAGMCLYESLKDGGALGLADVADMNDALDAERENARRLKDS